MKVVSFYTPGSPYQVEAMRMIRTLRKARMDFDVKAVDLGKHDWYKATAYKATFIRDKRNEHKGPIMWIDVDAVVHQNCNDYFKGLEGKFDFAAHWFQGPAGGYDRKKNSDRLLSGTMWFDDSVGARRLLGAWVKMNETFRDFGVKQGGGQKNLWFLLTCLEGIKIHKLPGRYCYVFDKAFAYPTNEPRIIEHLIASRENRGLVRVNRARRQRIRQLDKKYGRR